MTRHIKRGGKVWINVYPDRPLSKKPAETRMGSGKGSPEWWIANIKPGRVLFELSGVPEDIAREAMRRAIHKLPMKAASSSERQVRSDGQGCDSGGAAWAEPQRAGHQGDRAEGGAVHLRFQAATGQLESHGRLRAVRKDIARIYTVLTERELGIIETVTLRRFRNEARR